MPKMLDDTMVVGGVELRPVDRCDGCSARARNVATREGFHPLLFCDHHLKRSRDNLISNGWEVFESEAVLV